MRLKHVISTQQFLDTKLLDEIFDLADKFQRQDKNNKLQRTLAGKLLASVFYEPSTRTRFSFESAMLKLGGGVLSTESAGQFSSAIKGESLEDSIRVIGGYSDVIVLRHNEIGSAERAARISPVPIINAGDGAGEHPTQALLDLYTIERELGDNKNFTIAMVGDLLYGRTIHSLIHLLPLCKNVGVILISPKELRLPTPYKSFLRSNGIKFLETDRLNETLKNADVVYMTRIQKERFASPKLYEEIKNAFILHNGMMENLSGQAIIMHPLPRNYEIHPEVDFDPRAAYFRQAQNGLYLRMALLELILA